ncbi:MAG: UDP-4-amino-4,6-dideoxy-N-acetyl-beta-L-altrosamine N-acetyltransferase [Tissierellia bacterium]|jgi:hypothetical protein|nr:UDP-4-amino-4,6-dideoxy-N-acetyl-beta-L-altrosamine N-acetyltransferase [Tissierellia bacterium]
MNIKLLRVKEKDLQILMEWRMRPDITKYMFTDPVLSMEKQKKWYEKLKQDNTQIRWVVYYDDIPIGSYYLVDIDYNNKRCEGGEFIAERKYRSLDLSISLSSNIYDYVFDVLDLNKIYGYIIPENKNVIELNKIRGFEVEGVLKQHVYKDGQFYDVAVLAITKDRWIKLRDTVEYDKFFIE